MKRPPEFRVDDEQFVMECIDELTAPYVDVRIDTIPQESDDADYSERPELLRKAAAWLVRAAEWLEQEQAKCL
jgi:hypothetical protein